MEIKRIFELISYSFKSALLCGLFLGAISFLILITFQKSFRSSTDLLIAQNQPGATDYYALSRSAEYLSNIIAESIYSEKFLNELVSGGKVHSKFVSHDKIQRLKDWQKIVNVKKNSNVGILNIRVFGETQSQTLEVSEGILDVLVNKNNLFLGKDQALEIRVLSGPIVEKNPSFGQIALASGGGFLLGIFLVILFALYRENFFNEDLNKSNSLELKRAREKAFFSEKQNADSAEISDPDYFAENSDYWRKRLEEENNHEA